MKKLFFILALVLFSVLNQLQAQNTACFTAEDTSGCTPFTLKLNSCTGGSDLYIIKGPEEHTGFFTSIELKKPGWYSITQVAGVSSGSGVSDTITKHNYIQVLPKEVPEFSVKTCEGSKVEVEITNSMYHNYTIDFGDGTTVPATPGSSYSHIYTTTTTKTITVTGVYMPENCGESATKTVEPFLTLEKPQITSVKVVNSSPSGSAELTFDANSPFKYKILQKIGTSNFTPVDTVINESGQQKILFSNLDTKNFPVTYKVVAFDDCGEVLASEEISTIPFTIENGNNQIDLNWTSSPNFDAYTIYKNGEVLKTLTSSDYTDSDILCGTEYCYQLTGRVNSVQSVSIKKCVTGQSSVIPPAVTGVESSFSGPELTISWKTPQSTVTNYKILELAEGVSREVGTTEATTFSFTPTHQSSACYQIKYLDKCSNESQLSLSTCPVKLSMEQRDGNVILSWTPYFGNTSSVTYTVEKYDAEGNLIASFPDLSNTYFTDSNNSFGKVIYKIKVSGDNGFSTSSNEVELSNELILLIPSAFTPNGDGVNDTFKAEGKFVDTFKMTIFNNWGEVVYSTTDINRGWNGTIRGTSLVSGSYAYIIEVTDFEGKTHVRSGTLTLLK